MKPRAPLSLSATFVAAAESAGARWEPSEALEASLWEQLRRATTAWPGLELELEPESFIRHLAKLTTGCSEPLAALGELYSEDLYLVCACLHNQPAALEAFDRRFLAEVPAAVAKMDPSPAFADEVRQQLRQKLFLGVQGALPALAGYSGRGALSGWIKVAATRTALNLRRGAGKQPAPEDWLESPQALGPDPELEHLKRRYREDFERALRDAVAALPARSQALLRLYFGNGMSLEVLGTLYRVHLSTASRWLAQARKEVSDGVRHLLEERLGVSPSELESILGLVLSRLDASLSGILGKKEP